MNNFIHMTGTRARDVAMLVQLYGNELTGVGWPDEWTDAPENWDYDCLLVNESGESWFTKVRCLLTSCTEISREKVDAAPDTV